MMVVVVGDNPMNSDQFSRPGSPSGSTRPQSSAGSSSIGLQDVRATAGEAVSKLAEVAQQAGNNAKQAASSLASEANQKAKGLLNQQFSAGADLAGHVAQSAKCAADSLDQNAPQLANLVRGAADKVEEFSRDMRGQSVEQLLRTASDFTRRQPAVVFGLASLAGFLLFRVLKATTPSNDAHSFPDHSFPDQTRRYGYEPQEQRFRQSAGQFHAS